MRWLNAIAVVLALGAGTAFADVYPITSFTYLICYKDLSYLKDQAKAQAIVDFFWYATHDGQSKAVDLTYAPLSWGLGSVASRRSARC